MHPMRALRQYQKVNSHAQISEATPHRLVQMLMEGGLDRMAQAKGAIARGDVAQKGVLLGKAIDIIGGLREGLDRDKAESPEELDRLDELYAYMTTRLMQANLHSDPAIIDEVAQLMITVKSGWDAIASAEQ
ncbi:TPA: flagellar export chaperone FliS [Pseudomonas putida]|jgi:flagellar protein FliS|uniref:flagellar export chaperone FliS n=1 Tax=Pseudomonas TaxID=286 RepID=UPI00110CEC3A|nr:MULTISPECIES: flagellar export chaperone FliS [Pseudomonas]MDD1995220.1 flagellar export chaperone FliS [Pseudomonas putida]HDS0918727.1 flagellar export chaperone FliS [Pseudomonas putida]HDS0933866.1 flagellar export chaperone FliS [Pseudomonas putida]HDS1784068.1 flagellar export chaperone FliS [Pseudomonas putida]HDS3799870.1 flagellar export chaperone FliS [Pseudomonas putida]